MYGRRGVKVAVVMVWRDDADDGETAGHLPVLVGRGVSMRRIAVGQDVEGIASRGGATTMGECATSGRRERHGRRLLLLVVTSRIRVMSLKRGM